MIDVKMGQALSVLRHRGPWLTQIKDAVRQMGFSISQLWTITSPLTGRSCGKSGFRGAYRAFNARATKNFDQSQRTVYKLMAYAVGMLDDVQPFDFQ
jgi:hypothetical protein